MNAGLFKYKTLPPNYQGIAIYSEWEMDADEWDCMISKFIRH